MIDRTQATRLNAASWAYADERFNARKGDYARAIRDGHAPPAHVIETLNPSPCDRILHLLCNDGREAAAIACASGARFTGVDFSATAISFARALSADLMLDNSFVQAEVYAYLRSIEYGAYHKILLTLGSLRWLPDLDAFFRGCVHKLRPDGTLTVWDFHPLVNCFDAKRRLVNGYPCEPQVYRRDDGVRDYSCDVAGYRLADRGAEAVRRFHNPNAVVVAEYSCSHIISRALNADLTLRSFTEHQSSWEQRCLPWLEPGANGTYQARPDEPTVPATFTMQFTPAPPGEGRPPRGPVAPRRP